MILFTDEVEKYIPPRKGRRHVLRVIREILFFEPKKRGTNFNDALNVLNRVRDVTRLPLLVSDFLFENTTDETDQERKPADFRRFANNWAAFVAGVAPDQSTS